MEVEQTNFVTHLTITEQLYYWLSKNPSVKILSNKFPVVIINYRRKSNERILCKLSKNEILTLYSIAHVAMETTSNFTCRSKYFVSIFFTCQVQLMSCNLSLAMIWQMTYTHKLPKLCSASLIDCPWVSEDGPKRDIVWIIRFTHLRKKDETNLIQHQNGRVCQKAEKSPLL